MDEADRYVGIFDVEGAKVIESTRCSLAESVIDGKYNKQPNTWIDNLKPNTGAVLYNGLTHSALVINARKGHNLSPEEDDFILVKDFPDWR